MSLARLILNQVLRELERPSLYPSLHEQHFGLPLSAGYLRSWRNLNLENSGLSTVSNDKDGFKINLDVQQFNPNELSVKVANGYLVIDGKHEERSDEHGFISRHFTRRYKIPSDINAETLSSTLTSDGVLQLQAQKLGENERSIPIIPSSQPAVKQNSEPQAIKQNSEPQAIKQNSEPQKKD